MGISKSIAITGICFLFVYFYMRYLERHTIYYPMHILEGTPEDVGLRFEEVEFFSQDKIKLQGWFIQNNLARATVIFCHGNGGNISHRLDKILFLHKLGLNVFIFDYRGYGNSKGVPTESGLYLDSKAAGEYIKNRYKTEQNKMRIIVYGESLGGAVAIDLASKMKVDGLILEGVFTAAKDMAKIIYPFLPNFLITSKFDSLAKIKRTDAPKFLMHSLNDEIVPFSLGKKLFAAANEPKEFLELSGGHNDAFFISEQKIKIALERFLKEF